MEWVLRSPQMHSTFGNLGIAHPDGYHINENCNAALKTILHNILTEDKYLRSYRRSISFGQNITKDLIPLLLHAKEDETIELLVQILVNLTIPIECLLSVEVISRTDFGRHTIFEINNLLAATKLAFTDHRATKVIIDFLKKNIEAEQKGNLSLEQCTNISNSLLLLRNILHIPEGANANSQHTVQNQILWNIFSQSIDKILIKLMTITDAVHWGVTMVQLIALLYKDQHVVTLHKLLNLWLETSLSESSDDNESNTSPPSRGSEVSSLLLTYDPSSDSSDTNGSGKSKDESATMNNMHTEWNMASDSGNNTSETVNPNEAFQSPPPPQKVSENTACEQTTNINMKTDSINDQSCSENAQEASAHSQSMNCKNKVENSDCGYGTSNQIEHHESISTSSNEDEMPSKKPIHQKPHNPKQRVNTKARASIMSLQDRKRRKLVKRGKSNISINVHGLWHQTPTDDDISNVLKEFTVDFLLKGYNSLVQTLHNQILTNRELEIDTSHFFWLVTYFLKFATQIELDLERICSVLSFDIVSYLTAEGVNLCEQFELSIKLDGSDLKPGIRRLHLVVTAVREFVQAIEMYKKFTHVSNDDQDALVTLQIKMTQSSELRSLLVILLRYYNPKYQSKQYLQDLVVTNHLLLIFLDSAMKLPGYKGTNKMHEHIKLFATPEIMHQYGLLLEDYESNGEFVNDCIFTMMHHVGGELDCLISLFQPNILKTFTSIWKSEFEICDDWSDLIEYVINTFVKKPLTLQRPVLFRLDNENFDTESNKMLGDEMISDHATIGIKSMGLTTSDPSQNRWTEDELSTLSWYYMQCNSCSDIVGEIVKLFKEEGIMKTRNGVLQELFKQNLIGRDQFETSIKGENKWHSRMMLDNKEAVDNDDIGIICESLTQDGKSHFLAWVQSVLLETCYTKIYFERVAKAFRDAGYEGGRFQKPETVFPVPCPVPYHYLLYGQSIPLVPWNCEQAVICKDLKFLQLLHKLGFQMPVDTGKVFIRIPNEWTPDILYETAEKIMPIDPSLLKFSRSDLYKHRGDQPDGNEHFPSEANCDMTPPGPSNVYQIHKQKHVATMVVYTPMPGSSYNQDPTASSGVKRNWLEIIQKSQECRITYATSSQIDSVIVGANVCKGENDGAKMPPPQVVPSIPELPPSVLSTMIATTAAELPFSQITDAECCNSVCETASVASDLTRMYVSDEEDKSMIAAPRIDNRIDDDSSDDDDDDL